MIPQTAHFEVPAKDPNRLALFYHLTFGWQVAKWGRPPDDWTVVKGAEAVPVTDHTPDRSHGMACLANTVEVDNIDFYMMRVKAASGAVALEKQTVLSRGYFAYCTDVEGNVFGLWETDPNAGL